MKQNIKKGRYLFYEGEVYDLGGGDSGEAMAKAEEALAAAQEAQTTADGAATAAGNAQTAADNAQATADAALAGSTLYLTSVAISATTGDIASVSNAAITADHVVAECVFADSSAITTDVTWTTSAGQLVLNGTCTAATTANIVLVKKSN